MINTIDILRKADYFGGGENIEIAKGKYELVTTWKGAIQKIKRAWHDKKRN